MKSAVKKSRTSSLSLLKRNKTIVIVVLAAAVLTAVTFINLSMRNGSVVGAIDLRGTWCIEDDTEELTIKKSGNYVFRNGLFDAGKIIQAEGELFFGTIAPDKVFEVTENRNGDLIICIDELVFYSTPEALERELKKRELELKKIPDILEGGIWTDKEKTLQLKDGEIIEETEFIVYQGYYELTKVTALTDSVYDLEILYRGVIPRKYILTIKDEEFLLDESARNWSRPRKTGEWND